MSKPVEELTTEELRAEAAKLIDYLGPQQERTEREIPVVVLEKV
jgi:hypothetical protein